MTDALAPSSPQQAVPQGYAEKAMASLMQLHTELMDEKERRVELYRRLMEREQSLAELKSYVRLLEERAAASAPRAEPIVASAEVSPLRAEVEARSAAQASRSQIHAVPRQAPRPGEAVAVRSSRMDAVPSPRPSLVPAQPPMAAPRAQQPHPPPPPRVAPRAPQVSVRPQPAMAAVGARPGRPDGWKTW